MSAIEVHEQDAFADATAFNEHLSEAEISSETIDGILNATYKSGEHAVSLNDHRHFIEGSPDTCPQTQVDSPYVNATTHGTVSLGDAKVVASEPVPLTLVKTPKTHEYIILQIANQPVVDLVFSAGDKKVEIPKAGFGRYTVRQDGTEFRVERFSSPS